MFTKTTTTKEGFLSDLRTRIHQHMDAVQSVFLELDDEKLNQQPAPNEWSVLQCFDHLNLTHEYYRSKIDRALADPTKVGAADTYASSFWGGIYMYFSFNPKNSFPTAKVITPSSSSDLSRAVLYEYIAKQREVLDLLARVDGVDLRRTPVPIAGIVRFNLGDCFKVLVYHDELHIGQAERVLLALNQTGRR